jgi:decaprenylphospho-beta-D-ribofuranose 2-oxidase
MRIAGWGRTPWASVEAARPERMAELVRAVTTGHASGLIAHGQGRSYGDQALNDGGGLVLTGRLDRLLDFDVETGLLECEPGVTFATLLDVFLERGWIAPTTPGTAFATIGGAVANDVHGKNHEAVGSFGDHVAWLELVLASGEVVRASREEEPELFRATIGGGGLTGIISRVAFRMAPAPSSNIVVREERIGNLDAFIERFRAASDAAAFSVGWIDAMAEGPALGRGILELGEFAEGDGAVPPLPARRRRSVPFVLPGFALSGPSVRLFNRHYFNRVPPEGRQRTVPLDAFFYPLDAILEWNRIYGPKGFNQFQCVLPDAAAAAGLRQLMEAIAGTRRASFLAVLKRLGGNGRGHLSFPMAGFTLALDFPHRAKSAELFARLEAITLAHGGRIYLAKDALLSAEGFRAMYPELPAFRQVLERVDPEARFQSDQARRLRIREAGT